jgi:hypothetical protein
MSLREVSDELDEWIRGTVTYLNGPNYAQYVADNPLAPTAPCWVTWGRGVSTHLLLQVASDWTDALGLGEFHTTPRSLHPDPTGLRHASRPAWADNVKGDEWIWPLINDRRMWER